MKIMKIMTLLMNIMPIMVLIILVMIMIMITIKVMMWMSLMMNIEHYASRKTCAVVASGAEFLVHPPSAPPQLTFPFTTVTLSESFVLIAFPLSEASPASPSPFLLFFSSLVILYLFFYGAGGEVG